MNTKILKSVSTAVSLVVGMGSAYPALAVIDELLMYPGSNCRVLTGAPKITPDGRLENKTLSKVTVQCPMYDNGTNFVGRVWVIDTSNITDVVCTSEARNPLGNTGTLKQETSGFSNEAKSLLYTGPAVSGSFTYRFYSCTLPAGSTLINYRGKAS